MRFSTIVLALVALSRAAAFAASSSTQSPAVAADLILRNGRVYTDPLSGPTEGRAKGPLWSQAISVRGGNILSIGRNEAVDKDRGPATRVIELKGRVVLPGFNDANVDMIDGGLSLGHADLGGATSIAQIQDRLRLYAAAIPRKTWIIGEGWDETQFSDRRALTKEDLDAAVSDRPVLAWRSDRRVAAVNTKALEALRIASGTADPRNGSIVRHTDGSPTGILVEAAAREAAARAETPGAEEIKDALLSAQALFSQLGITSAQGGPVRGETELRVIEALYNEHKLKVRLALWGALESPHDFLALRDKYKYLPEEWVSFQGVYGEIDGMLSSRTAALDEPYSDDAHAKGEPYYTQDKLNALVLDANRAGLTVVLRATGDRAVSMAINALSAAKRQLFNSRLRNRVDHIVLAPPFAYEKFSDFHIIASLQPAQLGIAAETPAETETRLGAARAKDAFPMHSFISSRAPLAFSSEWPAGFLNPIRGLFAAVYRQSPDGKPLKGWQPQQRISLDEAIDAYTLGPAFATREEHVKGSLREGKYADLIVLDQDPFKAKGKDMLKIPVYLTIAGGKVVHDGTQSELKAGR